MIPFQVCGYTTKRRDDFKRHQFKHNPSTDRGIKCKLCNKSFFALDQLRDHINVHAKKRPHLCEVCGVRYSRRSSLSQHRALKHPQLFDKSKRCCKCHLVRLRKESMTLHLQLHDKDRQAFPCSTCGKKLSTKSYLTQHTRLHLGDKPYECNFCQKHFTAKYLLANHILVHTGERPFGCKMCPKAYTKRSALKAHNEKTHHCSEFAPQTWLEQK